MTIKVYPDRIEFNTYTIKNTPTGIDVNGTFNAVDWEYYSIFGGTINGYTSGGFSPPATDQNTIDKFPFSTFTTATSVGTLATARRGPVGQSSNNSGYTSGGEKTPSPAGPYNVIEKFPFVSNANASDVGDLTLSRTRAAGQSSSISGYTSGGYNTGYYGTIDKFPFSIDSNATNVGSLTVARWQQSGQSSATHGYTSGGEADPSNNQGQVIDKFPFAADSNATDVGDLSQNASTSGGQSSSTYGYVSNTLLVSDIHKFSFSTDGNSTSVGDLSQSREYTTGQSSTTYGYNSGGILLPSPQYNTIDRFSFTTDGNATDIGDLSQARYSAAGQQV